MELNIRELINGGPARLRYVWRFSTSRVQHPESVAEHSYYVALYCLLIADWVNDTPATAVDLPTLLRRAILHDLEEARSGDFPRLFKHSDSRLKVDLDRASETALLQLLGKLVSGYGRVAAYVANWKRAKCEDSEGAIVEFSDFLAVLGFMMQEEEGGNRTIKNHVLDMKGYFDIFKTSRFDFIRPLVDQAEAIMKEMFPDDYCKQGQP